MNALQPRSAVQAELNQLMRAFFEAVSFEDGARPHYSRIHRLFIDAGLLIKNSGAVPEISTPGAFIEPRQAGVDAGELTRYFEAELPELTQVFGNVASGGMISTQFNRTPDGWRMTSMAWDDERPGLALPAQAGTASFAATQTCSSRALR